MQPRERVMNPPVPQKEETYILRVYRQSFPNGETRVIGVVESVYHDAVCPFASREELWAILAEDASTSRP